MDRFIDASLEALLWLSMNIIPSQSTAALARLVGPEPSHDYPISLQDLLFEVEQSIADTSGTR
jgi:hypothetical protein